MQSTFSPSYQNDANWGKYEFMGFSLEYKKTFALALAANHAKNSYFWRNPTLPNHFIMRESTKKI